MAQTAVLPGASDLPSPPSGPRWVVLLALGIGVYGSYYAFDYIGPLAPVLSRQLGFSDSAIGLLQAVYSLPNMVAMLVCGVIIDRVGTRRAIAIFSALVFIGLAITALSPRLGIMASGRLLVGSGAEALALASNVAVARWFWRDGLSLGFALRSSLARLGSMSAQTSPAWAAAAYAYWQWPLILGVAFGGFCLIGAVLYWVLDARGERRFALGHTPAETMPSVRDVVTFNRSFWLIALLCVTFYGCIFPFQTFGQKFLIESRGLSPQTASLLVGMEPLFSMIGMPFFGYLVDRHGHRSLFMMYGSMLLVPVFLMLGYTSIPPVIPMAMMGVAFALVPAVMWPALAYVVDRSRLGQANGMLDTIQQIGLVVVNLLIGWANDRWLAGADNPAGYHASMWMFTGIAVLSVGCAWMLYRVESGPQAHGLDDHDAALTRPHADKETSTVKIADMNWMQAEQSVSADGRAVVPVGSTEQHGYLSLCVDAILAERVACDAAEPLGVPVFPVLAYGITPYFRRYPGSVSLRLDTYHRIVVDILDSLAGVGFTRILFVNGHGGNIPGGSVVQEWMNDHPGVAVKWHNWWNAPRTAAAVQAIDPDGSHASWMENFPWTRLPGVRVPDERKPMIDLARVRLMDAAAVRAYLGDGNFGGPYQKPDEVMLELWRTGVEETREALEGPWA